MSSGHLERDFVILAAKDSTVTSSAKADVETSGPPNFLGREWADSRFRLVRWKRQAQCLRKEVRAGSRTLRHRLLHVTLSL
jgi:hypothetical protein